MSFFLILVQSVILRLVSGNMMIYMTNMHQKQTTLTLACYFMKENMIFKTTWLTTTLLQIFFVVLFKNVLEYRPFSQQTFRLVIDAFKCPVNQHTRYQDPETKAATWNSAIIHSIICTCAFPTAACQNVSSEKDPFILWMFIVFNAILNILKWYHKKKKQKKNTSGFFDVLTFSLFLQPEDTLPPTHPPIPQVSLSAVEDFLGMWLSTEGGSIISRHAKASWSRRSASNSMTYFTKRIFPTTHSAGVSAHHR